MTTPISTGSRPAETRKSRDAAAWLAYAASPTFALMAWISAHDVQAMFCASGPGILPIGGMAFMYVLMSLFHLSPWLKRASGLSRRLTHSIPQTQGD